jgi:hypothetical protein
MGGTASLPAKMSFPSEPAAPGEGAPRSLTEKGAVTTPKFEGINNLYAMFARAAEMYPANDCFGWRERNDKGVCVGPFVWISYKTVHDRVKALAAGLTNLSLPNNSLFANPAFGMYSVNSADFQIIVLACFSLGMTCVPIYDTLGENILEYEVRAAPACRASDVSAASPPARAASLARLRPVRIRAAAAAAAAAADPRGCGGCARARGCGGCDVWRRLDGSPWGLTPALSPPALPSVLTYLLTYLPARGMIR